MSRNFFRPYFHHPVICWSFVFVETVPLSSGWFTTGNAYNILAVTGTALGGTVFLLFVGAGFWYCLVHKRAAFKKNKPNIEYLNEVEVFY